MVNEIEDRFFSDKRWQQGKECLNIENINHPPMGYSGDKEKWVNELTTFIYIYPKEWEGILREYTTLLFRTSSRTPDIELLYFRDDEGYLRKKDESDIYLRVCISGFKGVESLTPIATHVLNKWGFREYEKYCKLDNAERKEYLHQVKKEVEQLVNIDENRVIVTYEHDYEKSSFQQVDLYLDLLNNSYVIL